MEHLLAAFLGVVAGTLSAMFGVGGGLIFVPTLIFLGSNTHQAVATSLAAMIPAILVGSWRQTRYGAVRWKEATVIGIASIPTAQLGAAARQRPVERCPAQGVRRAAVRRRRADGGARPARRRV